MLYKERGTRILMVWSLLSLLMISLAGLTFPAHAAPAPDLTVEDVWLERDSQPGQPAAAIQSGEAFNVIAAIKNVGDATGYGFYLDVYYDTDYGRGGPDDIAPGEVQEWYVGPFTEQSGTHTTRWVVDPDSMIQELDDTNNGREYEFTVEVGISYSLEIIASVGGTTDPAPGIYSRNPGDLVSISYSITSQGGTFSGWDVSGPSCSGGSVSNPCTFNMPANAVAVTANFNPQGPVQVKSRTIFGDEFSGVRVKVEWRESGHRRRATLATLFSLDPSPQGQYKFTAPSTVRVGGIQYRFAHWEDGAGGIISTSKSLTYDVHLGTTLFAVYGPKKYSLTVEVSDANTNSQIAGATVEISQLSEDFVGITNSRGRVKFGGIYVGQPVTVTITKDGYKQFTITITITRNTRYQAQLTPA